MVAPLAHAVFVVGSLGSRAGLIAETLGRLRGAVVAVPGGSHVFSRGVAPLMGNFEVGRDNGLSTLVDRPALVSALRHLADDLLLRPAGGHRFVIDHSPSDVAFAALIREVYPDAHLVCVVRDGRDVVSEQPSLRAAAGVARSWCETNRSLLDLAGERVRIVRLEDVARDPDRELADLARWIGGDGGASFDSGSGHEVGRRATRSALVEALGGDVLVRLGYPLRRGPFARARRAACRALARRRGWTR